MRSKLITTVTCVTLMALVAAVTDHDSKTGRGHGMIMELEEKWYEKCAEQHKCQKPPNMSGMKSYTLDKSKNYKGVECIDGFIDFENVSYPCNNMRLLSYVSLEDLGSKSMEKGFHGTTGLSGIDLWGWKSDENKLYALTCQLDGISIVDVTNPTNPIPVAYVPSNIGLANKWRDVKVYKNYMFAVADYGGGLYSNKTLGAHGLQIYDLNNIQNIDLKNDAAQNLPITVDEDDIILYTEFGECHNIIINEESGYLYAVGTDTCLGGLHVVDIRDPSNPEFVGCFNETGYIHDGQCITYKDRKKNSEFYGRELCFTADGFSAKVSIIDVTDKDNMFRISSIGYERGLFAHQLWITPNYEYLLLNDELNTLWCDGCDEEWILDCPFNHCQGEDALTRTYIFNIKDLENPQFIGTYHGEQIAIPHNLYIDNDGKYAYLNNYEAGIRVLDISGIDDGIDNIHEIAYFDSYPEANEIGFNGVFSSYIYFEKFILLQTIDRGLFILEAVFKEDQKNGNKNEGIDFASNFNDNSSDSDYFYYYVIIICLIFVSAISLTINFMYCHFSKQMRKNMINDINKVHKYEKVQIDAV